MSDQAAYRCPKAKSDVELSISLVSVPRQRTQPVSSSLYSFLVPSHPLPHSVKCPYALETGHIRMEN